MSTPHPGSEKRVADVMVTRPKTHGPEVEMATLRALFDDDHVQMALVVAADGRLVTTIERADLALGPVTSRAAPAATLGTLAGRTVRPTDLLAAAAATLTRRGRSRLAVVDDAGRLVGLLCRKRSGTGFCSDEGIAARAAARGDAAAPSWPAKVAGL